VAGSRRDGPTPEDKLEALHYQLIEAVADLASSEGWMRMLGAAARFHAYSPSNVLLIAAQRPDATRVAGIRTWNSLGRHVNKGEHGIAILAPCVYPTRPVDDAPRTPRADAALGREPQSRPASSPSEDEPAAKRVLRGFKVVHVFDVTQTDGEPLPDVEPPLLHGDAPDRLWDHLAGLLAADGYRIERGPCHGANGYTDYTHRIVRVLDDVEPAQAAKTLAHELGHIRADHEHRFPDYATSRACRGQAEVEAESIAYLVTAQAGLNASDYSVPYLAMWSGGEIDLLRESMTQVINVARAISPAAVEATAAAWRAGSVTSRSVSTSLASSAPAARAL
jgi:hypothetical protein